MSDSDISNYICSRQGLQSREVLVEQGGEASALGRWGTGEASRCGGHFTRPWVLAVGQPVELGYTPLLCLPSLATLALDLGQ